MLGRQHALAAVLSGVGVAACIPSAPWPIRTLVVVVTGGAGLLPDLDTPQGTAARSLGPVTRLLAVAVDRGSLAIYHATRETGDSATRRSGHRLATHTVPACVLAGLLVAVLGLVSPVALVVACAVLGGLLALGLRQAGFALAVSTGVLAWWALDSHSSWWWAVPVAVTVGCLCHLVADAMTATGIPALWPLASKGERWRMVTLPVTFTAGDHVETALVAPTLILAVAVSVASVTGLLPVLASAVAVALG